MAAGLGTRLRPFTDLMPKPYLPVLGVPIIQFAVDALERAGVTKIILNIHHLPSLAREQISKLETTKADLIISDESDLLLGSAGGIKKAQKKLGKKPFFYANADVICDADLSAVAHQHARLRTERDVTLTLVLCPPDTKKTGEYREIIIDNERKMVSGTGPIKRGVRFFSGVAVIEKEALESVPVDEPSDFFSVILSPAILQGKVGYLEDTFEWQDIGNPELWWRTQIDWLDAMEKKSLPPHWAKRIEAQSLPIASAGRIKKGIEVPNSAVLKGKVWLGVSLPEKRKWEIGPDAVLYSVPQNATSHLISYGNAEWRYEVARESV